MAPERLAGDRKPFGSCRTVLPGAAATERLDLTFDGQMYRAIVLFHICPAQQNLKMRFRQIARAARTIKKKPQGIDLGLVSAKESNHDNANRIKRIAAEYTEIIGTTK